MPRTTIHARIGTGASYTAAKLLSSVWIIVLSPAMNMIATIAGVIVVITCLITKARIVSSSPNSKKTQDVSKGIRYARAIEIENFRATDPTESPSSVVVSMKGIRMA